MYRIALTIFINLFLSVQAAQQDQEHCLVKLKDQSYIWGEHLEVYEDRWFYQAASPEVPVYELFFSENQTTSPFHFINQDDIEKRFCWSSSLSLYLNYLKEHDLLFKNELVKKAHVLTGNEGHHKHEAMFGNFAWDIGIVDLRTKQHSGKGDKLNQYYIYGSAVISPLKGTIIGAVTDQIDNPVDQSFTGDLSDKTNNYLTIQTSTYTYLSVVHFKQNSIPLKVGDSIQVGTYLGDVGNSGVSYLPHLHYTLYTYIPKLKRFISIPGYFLD